MAHIAVERNRRRQMNEHLKVLRSLTPCFYIKRGDQASIIGGVIEFIKELHQVMESLESNKRRKSLSPSPSPRTVMAPTMPPPLPQQLISSPVPSPTDHRASSFSLGSGALIMHDHENSSNHSCSAGKALFGEACCNSSIADVEAKMSGGSNVVVRTISRRIPGQIVKIITALEKLSFEVLRLNISSMEDTVLYSFILKIGLECPVSVEELAHEVQQSFGSDYAATADQLINV